MNASPTTSKSSAEMNPNMLQEVIFTSEEFNEIQTTIGQDGTPFFFAHHILEALKYSNPQKAIRTYCKRCIVLRTKSPQGLQEGKYIPESDVYRLILRSKLPIAETFAKLFYLEILPSMRKTAGHLPVEKINEICNDSNSLDDFLETMKHHLPRRARKSKKAPNKIICSNTLLRWPSELSKASTQNNSLTELSA